MKSKVITKFIENDDGISVEVHSAETLKVLIGIAEAIQLISEETKESKESIVSDINEILNILEEQK